MRFSGKRYQDVTFLPFVQQQENYLQSFCLNVEKKVKRLSVRNIQRREFNDPQEATVQR